MQNEAYSDMVFKCISEILEGIKEIKLITAENKKREKLKLLVINDTSIKYGLKPEIIYCIINSKISTNGVRNILCDKKARSASIK